MGSVSVWRQQPIRPEELTPGTCMCAYKRQTHGGCGHTQKRHINACSGAAGLCRTAAPSCGQLLLQACSTGRGWWSWTRYSRCPCFGDILSCLQQQQVWALDSTLGMMPAVRMPCHSGACWSDTKSLLCCIPAQLPPTHLSLCSCLCDSVLVHSRQRSLATWQSQWNWGGCGRHRLVIHGHCLAFLHDWCPTDVSFCMTAGNPLLPGSSVRFSCFSRQCSQTHSGCICCQVYGLPS